ncbi:MAG TPA: hypothetical protein VK426_09165 [Methanobacterium sp.]|nr:hypothetical protein [Methanobacterium sp.]
MVSNEEISRRLRNKREGQGSDGYLVCNNCGGYYELQQGESWKDFDTECECGGQLVQNATNSLLPQDAGLSEEAYEHKMYETEILIAYIAIFLFWPVSIILAIYLLTRDNKRAKSHGKIIIIISLGLFFIVFGISALLIYHSYFSYSNIDQYQDIASVRPSVRSSAQLVATSFLNF